VGPRFAALREELLAHASVIGGLEQQAMAGQRPMLDVLDAYQRLHNTRLELAALVLGEVHSTLRVAQHTGRLGAYSAQPVR
jgi:outer membrane protein TolC